jgi:hypothetical protein
VGELSSRGLLRRDLLLAFVFTGENYFRDGIFKLFKEHRDGFRQPM